MTSPVKFVKKLNRSRLHEEIALMIQKKILRGDIAPGEKMPTERELAETLDVNRSTIREALRKLEIQDLVEIRHGDGVYVQNYLQSGNLELIKTMIYLNDSIDREILQDLFNVRRIVSPEIACQAASNRSDEDLDRIAEVIAENAPIMERDIAINHAIALASGSIIYTIILNFFSKLFRDLGPLYYNTPENAAASERYHQEVFTAIKNQDAALARSLTEEVMVYAENEFNRAFAEQGPGAK